jgi:FHA domain/Double zinc ribbon/zinc-ribbon domain
MKCPTCGTENDAANRFCDQCGSRLEPSGAVPQAQAVLAAQPTAAAATCPSCGAVVLPGEAFCDECGASLSGIAPTAGAASYDAPTVYAPPTPSASAPAADSGQGLLCAACGHQNLPGDRFCDNCGAALAAPAPSVSSGDSAGTPPPPATVATRQGETPASVRAASADLPTAEQPTLSPEAMYESEKQRLEAEIARQQQIITQFEQMQAMFGAATPPAVTQGLAEAHDAQARAQAELDALPLPAPEPAFDPAEVKRLEDEIARQQQIITQFEQMQAMFGAATPPAVTQGLADARDAMARTQAELDALTSSAPTPAGRPVAPPTPPTAAAPPPPEPAFVPPTAAAPPPPEPAFVPPPVVVPSPPEPAFVPPPVVAPPPVIAPRLVIEEGGMELPLPTDKAEIIVGREDPISGIFPEVDLTPYGGETGGVSRQHARINRANGQWTITDLNSTNYTRVDGNKLDPSLPVSIKDGSRIQFGRIAVTFRM